MASFIFSRERKAEISFNLKTYRCQYQLLVASNTSSMVIKILSTIILVLAKRKRRGARQVQKVPAAPPAASRQLYITANYTPPSPSLSPLPPSPSPLKKSELLNKLSISALRLETSCYPQCNNMIYWDPDLLILRQIPGIRYIRSFRLNQVPSREHLEKLKKL